MADDILKDNEKLRSAILERISSTAAGFPERALNEGLEIVYAREIDHLYVTVGSPRESLSIPADGPMHSVVLYDPATFEITGFEVPFFMEKLDKEPRRIAAFWQFVAELIRSHGDTVYIPGHLETERAERAFRDLALV